MIDTSNVIVRFLENAPTKFHGATCCNEDGFYTIVLDPNDSYERRLEAYEHELKHIQNGDFEKENVQSIEVDTHNN